MLVHGEIRHWIKLKRERMAHYTNDIMEMMKALKVSPPDSNSFLDRDLYPKIIPMQLQAQVAVYLQSFEELFSSFPILRALYEDLKCSTPERMHAIGLRMITTTPYKNLVVQARRNSGFDKCYILGILHRIQVERSSVQVLILCPTLEMAKEINALVLKLARYTNIRSQVANDPNTDSPIISHVVIGVPDTLSCLVLKDMVSISELSMLVIEAADQMQLSLGEDARALMDMVNCQLLFIYSTLTDKVNNLIPVSPLLKLNRLFINQEEYSVYLSKRWKVVLSDDDGVKSQSVRMIVDQFYPQCQVIIYVSPTNLDKLRGALDGLSKVVYASQLHGSSETGPIIQFKSKQARVLVTSVPISTGFYQSRFDMAQVELIIFYDIPLTRGEDPDYETYYRLATRAGINCDKDEGCVLHMLTRKNESLMAKIESYFGRVVARVSKGYAKARDKEYGSVAEVIEALKERGLKGGRSVQIWDD